MNLEVSFIAVCTLLSAICRKHLAIENPQRTRSYRVIFCSTDRPLVLGKKSIAYIISSLRKACSTRLE